MAKESGLAMSVVIDDSAGSGQDIDNDILSIDWQQPSGVDDVTGLDKSAHERLLLLADFSVSMTAAFNDASDRFFAVFKNYRTLSGSEVGRTTVITHSGQILSNEVLYSSFDHSRGNDGNLRATVQGSLADGTVPAWTT